MRQHGQSKKYLFCYLTIKSDTGQHLQLLGCLIFRLRHMRTSLLIIDYLRWSWWAYLKASVSIASSGWCITMREQWRYNVSIDAGSEQGIAFTLNGICLCCFICICICICLCLRICLLVTLSWYEGKTGYCFCITSSSCNYWYWYIVQALVHGRTSYKGVLGRM